MKKYKMIQIEESAYIRLKEYCDKHDKKLGRTVATWINEKVNQPRNVLHVK